MVGGSQPIDIIDYVNGIGNCSREQYTCTRTPRYSLHPVANQILATKCPKTVTAAHLSINNSKTKAVSSSSQAHSSEGVLLLAVDTRERVAKLLR